MNDEPSEEDSLSVRLILPVEILADDFARGIAYETIRQHLFGSPRAPTIGRYQLEKLIGRGGMSEVYSATDPELGRRVAIKRVGWESSDEHETARLRDALMRDARSAARVQHPHVVEIHDCGIENEELYVVMEQVEGPNLAEWLAASRRSWREIVEVFIQAGDGLAAAHAHGIVHRDFKPSNVLIGLDGRARVADFGLSRMAGDYRVTRPGNDTMSASFGSDSPAGTPQYMAPEQYRGAVVSPRADQFAYCNALYRALFHEPPFEGRTLEELANNVVMGSVRVPDDRHGAPRRLVRLVLRGLATAPERRHPSMDALVGGLRSVLRRRRRVTWLGGAAMVAAGTALAGYAWPREPLANPCAVVEEPWTEEERRSVEDALVQRSPSERYAVEQTMRRLDEFAEAWTLARQDSCEATLHRGEQSDEAMDLRLACLDRQRFTFTSEWSRFARPDGPSAVGAAAIVRDLAPPSDCSADVVRENASMAEAYRAQTDRSTSAGSEEEWRQLTARLADARVEASKLAFGRAHGMARDVAARAEQHGFRYLLADARLLQGVYGMNVATTEGELEQARDLLESAAPLAIESGSRRLASEVLLQMAQAEPRWRSYDVLQLWLDLAQAHANTLSSPAEMLARIEIARGDLYVEAGVPAQAILQYRRALERNADDLDADRAAERLGDALRESGDLQGARETWQQLRTKLEHRGGLDMFVLAATNHNLAVLAMDERAWDEAIELADAAVRSYSRSGSEESSELQRARSTLARALRGRGTRGDLERSREILRDVVEALEPRGTAGHGPLAHALDELVETELGLGNFTEATRTAEKMLALAHARHPDEESDREDVARARMMLARAAREGGDLERALLEISRAYAAMKDAPASGLRAEATFRYAQVAFDSGDLELAARLSGATVDTFDELPGFAAARDEVREWTKQKGLDHEPRPGK